MLKRLAFPVVALMFFACGGDGSVIDQELPFDVFLPGDRDVPKQDQGQDPGEQEDRGQEQGQEQDPGGVDEDPGQEQDPGGVDEDPGQDQDPGQHEDPGQDDDPGQGDDPGQDDDPGQHEDPGQDDDPGQGDDPGQDQDPGQDDDPGPDDGETCGPCSGGKVCIDNVCQCPDNLTDCSGTCTQLGTDTNCAGCGDKCQTGATCQNGACKCTEMVQKKCCGDNVCWFDSCGNQGAVVETCEYGCGNGACLPSCFDDPVGSCKAFYGCVGGCAAGTPGETCRNQCFDRLSTEGLNNLTNLDTCLANNSCYGLSGDDFSDCVDEYCIEPYYNCFWGCSYPTCNLLMACIDPCLAGPEADRTTCVNNCWEGATPEAQLDLNAALECNSNACPICDTTSGTECDECWDQATVTTCRAYWSKCVELPEPSGYCSVLWRCFQSCDTAECQDACVAEASPEANQMFDAIYDCIDANCGTLSGSEWLTCANASINFRGACKTQMDTCMADRAYGTGLCLDLWNCYMGCGTAECREACRTAASRDANTKLNNIFACINTVCDPDLPESQWNTCANAAINAGGACEAVTDVCFEDRVYGTGTCNQLWECYMPCTDDTCRQTCVGAASKRAIELLQDVFDCINGVCDSDVLDDDAWLACANASINAGGVCKAKYDTCRNN